MALIEVVSDTHRNPDILYTVNTETGECSCPLYVMKLKKINSQNPPDEWRFCKHLQRARLIEREKAACAS